MLIYIAGPYRAKNGRTVADNIAAARKVALEVAAAGHVPVTPHLMTAHFDDDLPGVPDSYWLDATMDVLRRCDAILVLPGWQDSEGTLAEMAYARDHGMPHYWYEQVPGMERVCGIPPIHPTEARCPEQARAFIDTVMGLYRTHLKKNADYSPANILGTGRIGLVTRLWDKMARLMNLEGFDLHLSRAAEYRGAKEASNEPVEDAYLDLACYGIIGLLLRKGKWGR